LRAEHGVFPRRLPDHSLRTNGPFVSSRPAVASPTRTREHADPRSDRRRRESAPDPRSSCGRIPGPVVRPSVCVLRAVPESPLSARNWLRGLPLEQLLGNGGETDLSPAPGERPLRGDSPRSLGGVGARHPRASLAPADPRRQRFRESRSVRRDVRGPGPPHDGRTEGDARGERLVSESCSRAPLDGTYIPLVEYAEPPWQRVVFQGGFEQPFGELAYQSIDGYLVLSDNAITASDPEASVTVPFRVEMAGEVAIAIRVLGADQGEIFNV